MHKVLLFALPKMWLDFDNFVSTLAGFFLESICVDWCYEENSNWALENLFQIVVP